MYEQVYLQQEEFGKSSRNGYHNKEWGLKMESIGLMPSNTDKSGGKKTGQQMTHYIIEGGAYEKAFKKMSKKSLLAFMSLDAGIQKAQMNRTPIYGKGKIKSTGVSETPIQKAKNKVKYTCGCGYNVWGKPFLHIICRECEKKFIAQN